MNGSHTEPMARISLTLNGRPVTAEVPARKTLLDAVREELGQTGTHAGCEHGVCGCCNVLLDGKVVRSCLLLAVQADGHDIRTVESLGSPERLGPLQRAFAEKHAMQCGYCTPGMIMAAADLLAANPDPDESEIRTALSGNLCRCTGYMEIVDAVKDAAGRIARGETAVEEPPALSARRRRRPLHRPTASRRWKTAASSPARAPTSTTSRCRTCFTWPRSARPTPTPGSGASTPAGRRRIPG